MLYAHTCAHIAPAEFIRMRISIIVSTFNIPLWNLRREQQISRQATCIRMVPHIPGHIPMPYSQYPKRPGEPLDQGLAAPRAGLDLPASPPSPCRLPPPGRGALALPTVSSHTVSSRPLKTVGVKRHFFTFTFTFTFICPQTRSLSFALSARRTTTGPVETQCVEGADY